MMYMEQIILYANNYSFKITGTALCDYYLSGTVLLKTTLRYKLSGTTRLDTTIFYQLAENNQLESSLHCYLST